MENDYAGVADALAGIPVEQMDMHEKYLLAVVYIRGQSVDSFNMYTKERLIQKLDMVSADSSLTGEDKTQQGLSEAIQ